MCSFNTNRHTNLIRHEKTCTTVRKTVYKSGVYEPKKPLYLRARDLGFEFPTGYCSYPYLLTWDIECALEPISHPFQSESGDNPRTIYTNEHSLLSIAFATNFQHPSIKSSQCVIRKGDSEQDKQDLLDTVLDKWKGIQDLIHTELSDKFKPLLHDIDTEIERQRSLEEEFMFSHGQNVKLDKSPLELLKDDLLKWLKQLVCVSFNGGKYDLNVIKQYLFPKLSMMHGARNISVLKKGNTYTLISTPDFRFIDAINFLPPGHSLEEFLKAFDAGSSKQNFPYEAITCVGDLDRDYCPPKEAFTSNLKGTSMSEEKWNEEVISLWNSEGMETWRDYLIYYNLSDVVPFITGLRNFESYFKVENSIFHEIDLFKFCPTISSASYYLGFASAPLENKFFLCNEQITKLMKNNITGGYVGVTPDILRRVKQD